MSSQDSDGESLVAYMDTASKPYDETDDYEWPSEEEEDEDLKRMEFSSGEEEEDVPLPQPGDMHVEFKKSSMSDSVKVTNVQLNSTRHV